MTNLFTQDQIRRRCVNAGFTHRQARIMSAIAMVEAPAKVDGVHYADCDLVGDQELANSTWGFSYSFFQVRSLRAHRGTGQHRDELRLPTPWFAIQSARTIFLDQGFQAWSTYNSGAYKAYLQDQFPPPSNTWVVQSGDTLGSIAQTVDVPWDEIARLNNLHSPYTIYIGQHLKYA
jgi:hypothetical protein